MGHASVTPKENHAICEFDNVAPGTYAIAVLHDENSNGDMDYNIIGMPIEGYGFSNNVRARMLMAPSFKAASFEVRGEETELSIKIVY
jgi:uncharacterized protein (DUF2141 family)